MTRRSNPGSPATSRVIKTVPFRPAWSRENNSFGWRITSTDAISSSEADWLYVVARRAPGIETVPFRLREYPRALQVTRLNRQGSLSVGQRRYFVCEALDREWVGKTNL